MCFNLMGQLSPVNRRKVEVWLQIQQHYVTLSQLAEPCDVPQANSRYSTVQGPHLELLTSRYMLPDISPGSDNAFSEF